MAKQGARRQSKRRGVTRQARGALARASSMLYLPRIWGWLNGHACVKIALRVVLDPRIPEKMALYMDGGEVSVVDLSAVRRGLCETER